MEMMAWQERSMDRSRTVWSKRKRDLTADWLTSKDLHGLEQKTLKHTSTTLTKTEVAGCQPAHTFPSVCQGHWAGLSAWIFCASGVMWSSWTNKLWIECVSSRLEHVMLCVRPFKMTTPSVWNLERFKVLFFCESKPWSEGICSRALWPTSGEQWRMSEKENVLRTWELETTVHQSKTSPSLAKRW